MPNPKRPRGRPPGSGKNDDAYLTRVADLIVADAGTKPTTAIKRVIYQRADAAELDDTLVRRLQGKWKTHRVTLIEAARQRHDDKRPHQANIATQSWSYAGLGSQITPEQVAKMMDAVKPLYDRMRSPEVTQALLETGNRCRAAIEAFANSPLARQIEEFARSPAAKRLAEWAASPQAQNMAENLKRLDNQHYYLTPPPKR